MKNSIHRNTRIALIIFFSIFSATSAFAGNLIVASNGKDTNPGTYLLPLATLQKAIDLSKAGDTIIVRSGLYPVNTAIRIVNKQGAQDYPITISGENPVVFRAAKDTVPGLWRGIIEIENSGFIKIERIAVENSSFFGFRILNSHDITLSQNRSTVSLGSGLYARDSRNIHFLQNDVSRFCDQNEKVQGVGCQEGITLANVNGFSVTGNLVHDAPQRPDVGPGGGEGIDAKQGTVNGIIAFNNVWNLVQLGIYVDGWKLGCSNIEIYGNRVWNVYMGIVVSSEMGGTVKNIRIHDNIIHETGVDGINVTNFKSGTEGDGLRSDILIFNNTILNSGVKESKPPFYSRWVAFGSFPDYGTGINILTENVSGIKIINNIIAGSKTAAIQIKPGALSKAAIDRNMIWPSTVSPAAKNATNGSRSVIADPGFVDPEHQNWHLRAYSPAAASGLTDLPLTVDADGITRAKTKTSLGALQTIP